MNVQSGLMGPKTLEQMLEMLDEAGIERAFLIAAHSGRPGLPGCYHMPYEVVARACEQYPDRFSGLAGIDPFDGMNGVKAFEDAVTNMGFIGAHLYPHWFELAPDHRKYYPFYAKCWELNVSERWAADRARPGRLRFSGTEINRHTRRHPLA
jgi:predicted TIM-barrel fold metal-dependent hydrolase